MMTVTSNDARTRWSDMVDATRTEPVEITRRGKTVAVLINPDFFERALDALEEIEDLKDTADILARDEPWIPLDELRSELGL